MTFVFMFNDLMELEEICVGSFERFPSSSLFSECIYALTERQVGGTANFILVSLSALAASIILQEWH